MKTDNKIEHYININTKAEVVFKSKKNKKRRDEERISNLGLFFFFAYLLPKLQSKCENRTNTVFFVVAFMTDGSLKVKDTHGAACRGIGSIGHPRVSALEPRRGHATKGSFF